MAISTPVGSVLVRAFVAITALFAASVGAVPEARADNGDRISVEVVGQGPDVILVPGYASTREVWRETANTLSARYRVHLVQLAGFGDVPWTHGDGPFLQPAIDELAIYAGTLDRPAYIGHSMGGLMGLKLAQDHPGLLTKVMSVDSLPFYGSLFSSTATIESVRPAAEQMRTAILGASDEMFRNQQGMTAVAMTLKEERRAEIVDASIASDRQALATAISELVVTDLREGLPSMTTPFWAVYALDNSSPYGAKSAEVWTREYKALPNVRVEAVQDSRHFIMFDQPERLNALIDAFLNP